MMHRCTGKVECNSRCGTQDKNLDPRDASALNAYFGLRHEAARQYPGDDVSAKCAHLIVAHLRVHEHDGERTLRSVILHDPD